MCYVYPTSNIHLLEILVKLVIKLTRIYLSSFNWWEKSCSNECPVDMWRHFLEYAASVLICSCNFPIFSLAGWSLAPQFIRRTATYHDIPSKVLCLRFKRRLSKDLQSVGHSSRFGNTKRYEIFSAYIHPQHTL